MWLLNPKKQKVDEVDTLGIEKWKNVEGVYDGVNEKKTVEVDHERLDSNREEKN